MKQGKKEVSSWTKGEIGMYMRAKANLKIVEILILFIVFLFVFSTSIKRYLVPLISNKDLLSDKNLVHTPQWFDLA